MTVVTLGVVAATNSGFLVQKHRPQILCRYFAIVGTQGVVTKNMVLVFMCDDLGIDMPHSQHAHALCRHCPRIGNMLKNPPLVC